MGIEITVGLLLSLLGIPLLGFLLALPSRMRSPDPTPTRGSTRERGLEGEASEEVEARLQRLLDMLRGLCPELDRLAPGAGRATLSPQFDSVGELAAAIDRGFWSLVAGRAAVQRRLLRAVRLSAEERRGHEAECATLKAQHEAALHAATQSASQERLNLEMEKADSAGLRHQLEEKVRFLEAEGQLLREREGEVRAVRRGCRRVVVEERGHRTRWRDRQRRQHADLSRDEPDHRAARRGRAEGRAAPALWRTAHG